MAGSIPSDLRIDFVADVVWAARESGIDLDFAKSAGPFGVLDRYIGYYEPYATSHDALDRDRALPLDVGNLARALLRTARALRHGELVDAGRGLREARPK